MSAEQTHEVEFSLFAPYNEEVALIGSWNDWQPTPMQKDERGHWRATVPLADGTYEYKFLVKSLSYFMPGQTAAVFDPYATQITLDADENSLITLKDGQRVITTYQWQHDDKPLPDNHELVIYELHVGDFSGGLGDEPREGKRKGRFIDVIEKMDYLADLGINAIELMPVKEFPGERSWGYNLRSLFAVENSYGTLDDLCRLIDEAHGRGIRVIVDGVYNHSESEAPFTKIDFAYWYHQENPDPPQMQWGPKFNYYHHDTNLDVWPARQYVLDSIMFWIDIFHIDGIRFDATAAINNYEFLGWLQTQIYQKIGSIKPFITIAEHSPQDPTITGVDGPLDAAWHEHFMHQAMATVLGQARDGREPYSIDGLMSVMDARLDGFGSAEDVVNYLNNHDQDRILWQLGEHAKCFGDAAFRRNKLGAALLLTSPGKPMLWMGEEFGESAPKTTDYQPLDWALLANDRNNDLRNYYKGLIHLRKHTPAFHGDHIELIMRDDERGIFAFKRWNDEGNVAVIAANLHDRYAGEFTVANAGLEDGTWHEYLDNYDNHVQGGALRDTLAESEVKVFIKV